MSDFLVSRMSNTLWPLSSTLPFTLPEPFEGEDGIGLAGFVGLINDADTSGDGAASPTIALHVGLGGGFGFGLGVGFCVGFCVGLGVGWDVGFLVLPPVQSASISHALSQCAPTAGSYAACIPHHPEDSLERR